MSCTWGGGGPILGLIPISASSLGPRLPVVLFFSAARPPVDRACQHHSHWSQSPRGPPRSSTKWLKEPPQVSSEDVHYILLFCGNEQQLFRSGLQVPPSHTNVRCAGLPTLTVLPWVSRFQCRSHGLTATQANLTGFPLRRVNIYSNGASDADFLPHWRTKNAAWCWKRSPNFAYRGRRLHVHDTKPLCKRHRLVLMRFLTGNRRSSSSGCSLRAILLEPHPPDKPVSRFLDILGWQAWMWGPTFCWSVW